MIILLPKIPFNFDKPLLVYKKRLFRNSYLKCSFVLQKKIHELVRRLE